MIFTVWVPIAAQAQTYPDYTETYVNDFADLLPEADEARIRDKLIELKEKKDIEFTVVTINLMSNYGHSGAIEPFATGLFNYWGVGDAQRNDGVMMLIARFDREMRIEVGAGYGTRMNKPMQIVIDSNILPYFRRDDYIGGIEEGVDEVILELTGRYPGEYDKSTASHLWGGVMDIIHGLGNWLWAILGPLMLIPVQAYRRWKRNTPRICPRDGSKMVRLDEVWDDNHLQQGQIKEEQLKSVDYDVWDCPKCNHVTVEGYKAWFSQYGACRSCGYRTVEGDTTVLKTATTSSTGKKRIDYHCHHCQDAWSVTRTIPKKSKSASSSGGFGGGSSSGGGASGSW
ncbi:TPM domain-containing protein [Actibacterium pelagium]|uniref:TPM domain-containing protein n=1 Tax=Actibacterium pelagium TaxID=2029103 RepID=UPI001303F69D|nr:TPM domain-containing protein [Actibacterium pelagium]